MFKRILLFIAVHLTAAIFAYGYGCDTTLARQALIDSYPTHIASISNNRVMFHDGTSLPLNSGIRKNFEQTIAESDILGMFFMPYHQPAAGEKPEYGHDAGRARNEIFLKKIYGASENDVRKNLVTINWFGKPLKFNKNNGAAKALEAVAAELALRPHLKSYMKSGGTFYWRNVRGANRLSAHAFGIALDIAVNKSDYWLWHDNAGKITYRNRIPLEIVDIFRKHGFIWGGAWYHFDTMHFEYRPEILKYAELYKQKYPDR